MLFRNRHNRTGILWALATFGVSVGLLLVGCDELLNPATEETGVSSSQSSRDVEAADSEDESHPKQPWPKQHTIEHGDTFFSIARRYYGDGSKWELIAEANPDLHATGLFVGRSVTIPQPR